MNENKYDIHFNIHFCSCCSGCIMLVTETINISLNSLNSFIGSLAFLLRSKTSDIIIQQMERRESMVAVKDQMPCMWSWSLRMAMNLLSKENTLWLLALLKPCWVGQVRITQAAGSFSCIKYYCVLVCSQLLKLTVKSYMVNSSNCPLSITAPLYWSK